MAFSQLSSDVNKSNLKQKESTMRKSTKIKLIIVQ